MSAPHHPAQNHLLAGLPAEDLQGLLPHLVPCDLLLGDSLYNPGSQLQHAYFPTTAIVSLQFITESGSSSETAGVGNEGVVGISVFMGGDSMPSSAIVQTAGMAYRLERQLLKQIFDLGGPFQRQLLRYTQALITLTAQTAVCNRHHSLHQQLARWLLLTLDRVPSGKLVMTQELIASMLGVRREGVTEAAGHLQQQGCIRYRRGHIEVLDRKGLESRTCECYAVVKTEILRLLPRAGASASHGTGPGAQRPQFGI